MVEPWPWLRGAPLLLLLTLFGGWASANEPCGRSWGIGFMAQFEGNAVREQLASDRSFTPELQLTDAPSAPLSVQPLLFIDGRLDLGQAALKLACGVTQQLAWRDVTVERSLHWLLLALPTVPDLLTRTPIEQLWAEFDGRVPPDVQPILFQELIRPGGGEALRPLSEALATGASGPPNDPAVQVSAEAPLELDALRWTPQEGVLDAADVTGRGAIARSRVGTEVPFELNFYVSDMAAGPLLVTCLLDLEQLAPFQGRVLLPLEARMGTSLTLWGSVRAERPGWSRLQCFLLADDPQLDTATHWPRPIDAAYLWVEAATAD